MSNKKTDLCAIIREQVIQYIRGMALHKNTRLPSENQLAEKFGVSRGTIRTVLALLEDEGKVIRRHGSGTYINHHAFEINTTLYPQVYFTDLIRLSGYTPTIDLLGAKLVKAGEKGERLGVPWNREIFEVRKVYRADGVMCIYCLDYLNPEHFQKYRQDILLHSLNTEEISIFQFMNKYSDIQMVWDIVRLDVTSSILVSELAPYSKEPRPYLVLDSVNYDVADLPVLYAHSYVNTDVIKYYLVRGRYDKEKNGL